MAVRHPPEDRVPPVARSGRGKTPRRLPRVVKYEEPPTGFFRRWARRIDRLLNGEVFTRSAGIYAAPKELRVGENISVEDLIAYLKRAGYVEKTQQADSSRGRYSLNGASVDVEPSKDATLDGQKTFPRIRVQFARGGKSITAIQFLDGGARYDKAQLEPELISSVTGSER